MDGEANHPVADSHPSSSTTTGIPSATSRSSTATNAVAATRNAPFHGVWLEAPLAVKLARVAHLAAKVHGVVLVVETRLEVAVAHGIHNLLLSLQAGQRRVHGPAVSPGAGSVATRACGAHGALPCAARRTRGTAQQQQHQGWQCSTWHSVCARSTHDTRGGGPCSPRTWPKPMNGASSDMVDTRMTE